MFIVGAGPGDPKLFTVRGVECMQQADVVVYDYLAPAGLLAHACKKNVERIYVGKQAGRHTLKQEDINRLLVAKASGGKTVVRLKGGDPFVFGRGGEECLALMNAGLSFEVVPGITSGIAAPCYAGIPVTHRECASSIALVTGHEDPSKSTSSISWKHLARGVDTLVFYMGVSNLPKIVSQLRRHGRPPSTPVALVRWGTTPRQQTVTGTLATIVDIVEREGIKPPAITVVGEAVKLKDDLAWFERRPLFGRRIINTRSRHQASALTERLAACGADVVELPTIETRPVGKGSSLETEIDSLARYHWVVFTSPNGVHAFFELLLKKKGDVRALGSARIASIGPGTSSAVRWYNVGVDVTAEKSVAEGLIAALKPKGPWKGRRVLLPRAGKARDVLPKALVGWGAKVSAVTAYTTIKPRCPNTDILKDIEHGRYDLITFSSSSTFENLVSLFGAKKFRNIAPKLKAASIGPITTSTMRCHGVEPLVEATHYTIPGLTQAIQEHYHR